MELERDLRFYLTSLLAIFLVTVIGATTLLQRMTPAIERILEENEFSLAATEEMLATLADTTPDPNREQRFAAALTRARANITEADEEPLLATIDQAGQPALAGHPTARNQAMTALLELAQINRAAMERADRRAQRLGRAGMWGVVMVGLTGFWIGLIVVRVVRKRYIGPLRDLHQTLATNHEGDRHRRANPGDAGVDLREMCGFVNELLDGRGKGSGVRFERAADLTIARALLTRLLDDRAEPTVVVDSHGGIDAANGAALTRLASDDGDTLREGLLAAARGDSSPALAKSQAVPGTDRFICVLAQ